MNKTFLSLTFVSTCLISNIVWANPSLGNAAIKQHKEIVQKDPNAAAASQSNTNIKAPEAEESRNTWSTAFDNHKKRVEAEPSLRSSNTSSTMQNHSDSGSLSNSAIQKHENLVNDNMK